ncbi:unnamed protein product [Sphagnum jensenii]|uniref:Alcohol dehydrogenase n=1 Tax=Sphagnum jensenii TaxID=128206 RepID=A0ABP1AMU7_9BRYO
MQHAAAVTQGLDCKLVKFGVPDDVISTVPHSTRVPLSSRCSLLQRIKTKEFSKCSPGLIGESSRRQIRTWTAARQFPALGQLAASVSTARIFQMTINGISTSDEQQTATADGTSTVGQVIKCKAAVAYAAREPLSFEDVLVAPPHAGEVRVKITHSSICQSDLYYLLGKDKDPIFPRIVGHEAAGIVESVGEGVTSLQPGDHVIPAWVGDCGKCFHCKQGKSNVCDVLLHNFDSGVMLSDKKTRFTTLDGKPIYHFFGISTFSQYSVMDEASCAKVNPKAPLDKICLLGCGVATGIGSAWKIAKVTPGSTVAVFGLGTIGLAVVEGCKAAGASRIIGIDIVPEKLELGKEFGLTDTINSKEISKPVQEVISEMTGGGVWYSFDCIGKSGVITSALESTQKAGGVSVILGLAADNDKVTFHPSTLLYGRTWTSGLFGGYKGKTDLPGLVEKYMDGTINLDHYITHKLPFSKINEGLELLKETKSLRCVMHYDEE